MKSIARYNLFTLGLLIMLIGCDSEPPPTANLTLTVLDQFSNPASGASVDLYRTLDDWNKEQNAVVSNKIIPEDGRLLLFELEGGQYHINIVKDSSSNWDGKQNIELKAARYGFRNTDFAIIAENNSFKLSSAQGTRWSIEEVYQNDESILSKLDPCALDDEPIFYKDKSFYINHNDTHCPLEDSTQRGTWEINTQGTVLTLQTVDSSTDWIIVGLSTQKLMIQRTIQGFSVITVYTVTK